MREKKISKMLPRSVTWAAGRLMVPFMELRKGNEFGVGDYEFNFRHVECEIPGFTQRISGRQLDKGL